MEAWGLARGGKDPEKRKADKVEEMKKRIAARVFKIKQDREEEKAAQSLQ